MRLQGAPVLLVPGLMAGDWAMRPLAITLHRRGHPTVAARIGFNVACTMDLVGRLESRLEEAARRFGRPAYLVGWSRGGTLGKLVTLRAPHLVAGLITLGSPNVNPLAVSPVVMRQVRVLTRLNAAGLHRMLGADCLSGECAQEVRRLLLSPFPAGVPYISCYSRTDGVVEWEACCDPAAECVEVQATHLRLGVDPRIMRLVADRLDGMERAAAAAA